MARKSFRVWGACLLLLLALCPAQAEKPKPGIEIAIAPFLSVRDLVQNYEPMRLYLEQRLRQPVLFITAPDYRSFHERTRKREYTYLITVGNAAYLAQAEAGYVPLLRPVHDTRPVLVVKKDMPLEHIVDLRGKVIALSDRLAVVSMQALPMLREAGLDPERDLVLKHQGNHGAAVNHVLSGEAAAAIVSDRALMQMAPAIREAVRVVHGWDKGAAPGLLYLASPRLQREDRDRFTRAALDFVRTDEGRALMERLGYGGLVPATQEDIRMFAPYGAALKRALAQPEQP